MDSTTKEKSRPSPGRLDTRPRSASTYDHDELEQHVRNVFDRLAQVHRQPKRMAAANECGSLQQQMLALDLYRDARAGNPKRDWPRLWVICLAMACDRPIPRGVER
jgi:hypothetical protein